MNDLLELLKNNEDKQELSEALDDGRFKFLGEKGFVAWLELVRDGQLWIYISHLYIRPEHRNFTNMRKFYVELSKFFRRKYPQAIFYWHRNNKFYYR